MNREIMELIDNLAYQVVSEYNIDIPVKHIEKVVKKFGGEVKKEKNFDVLCDGTICKEGEDSFTIVVYSYQNEKRKNFTIAHELGHLFIHMGFRTNEHLWNDQDERIYARLGSSQEESEANEFAAAFLMPESEYKKVLVDNTNDSGIANLEKVADYFGVSISAVANRGKNLGCLQ